MNSPGLGNQPQAVQGDLENIQGGNSPGPGMSTPKLDDIMTMRLI